MKAGASILATLGLLAALALPGSAPAATPSPAWAIQSLASPTNFEPGDESGLDRYLVAITNSGGEKTDGSPIKIVDTLPAGLAVSKVELKGPRGNVTLSSCAFDESGANATVSCEVSEALLPEVPGAHPALLYPGSQMSLEIQVKTPPSASGALVNRVEVEGGGASPASYEATNPASDADASAGFQEFRAELLGTDGLPARQAASHPYAFVTSFGVNTVAGVPGGPTNFAPAGGDLKEVEVALPPGLAANPTAVERCRQQDFVDVHGTKVSKLGVSIGPNGCPPGSAVGLAAVQQLEGGRVTTLLPIYNLVPPKGMPAQLGFELYGLPTYINTRLRSEGDYGVSAYVANTTEAKRITAARITVWGAPWEGSHDTLRGTCGEFEAACEAPGPARAFMRTPSQCGDPLGTRMSFTTWAQPATGAAGSFGEAAPSGCAAVPFTPAIEARPSTEVADSPAGFDFTLAIPQKSPYDDPEGLGQADLREARVRLPGGLVVNPASADGLGACTPAEVGLTSLPGQSPVHFDTAPARCPDAAKIGSVEALAPALDHPIEGSAYLAAQEDNPFNSLLAFYIVLEDEESGIVVKLAAKVSPDPATGQLETTVSESPQVQVEEFRFSFFKGARAPLRTPMSCGTHTTTTEMTPWSAPAGASAAPADSFAITRGPAGPCPDGAVDAKLDAGMADPSAGSYSPFSVRVTRPDGSGELASLTTSPPLGFAAKLAGVPYCPEAAIDQAKSREAPGGGREEVEAPSCPQASEVGTVSAGAGAGPNPFYVSGHLYLAGPYKGAPLSLVAIIPAVAGPFDLGTVVNRVASYVDPETAQVKAVADPLPRIIAGIPVDTRDLRVNLDRPGFALAPTSCEPKSVTAEVGATSGQSATLSERFQVGGCKALKFKPKVSLRLKGGTRRAAHPALRAVVTYPQKGRYANTASASVALPHSEFLEQSHIRTICTRVQFAANACPKGAIYGKARAFTPLLEAPLEGPVYLRSSNNPLPDLVLDLHGQIDVVAVARIDSHKGGIRTSFEAVPDAPLSKVVLEMPAGKKGLLVNSRNICNHTNRATARFGAHNGLLFKARPVLKDDCKGKGHKKHGKKQKGSRR